MRFHIFFTFLGILGSSIFDVFHFIEIICMFYYRPQRSWAKVIFSQACVKNSVHVGGGRVSASVHAGIHHSPPPRSRHPLGPGTPQADIPPRADPQEHPPRSRPPLEQTPPRNHPPEQTPPSLQTAAHGQRAAGTHPTGMHSWFLIMIQKVKKMLEMTTFVNISLFDLFLI